MTIAVIAAQVLIAAFAAVGGWTVGGWMAVPSASGNAGRWRAGSTR